VFAFCLGLTLLPVSSGPWFELPLSFLQHLGRSEARPATAEKPRSGAPSQVMACWQPEVQLLPDPAREGAPGPVLAGRVYVFDEEVKHPIPCPGSLIVDLYDVTSGQEVMLEEWRIDTDTMKRLLKRDVIGWGYSVALPWSTCKPEVARVVLKLKFERGPDLSKGALAFTSAPMTLSHPSQRTEITPPRP
jgi:hypothetical protein